LTSALNGLLTYLTIMLSLWSVQRSPSGKDRRSTLFNPTSSAFWKRLAHLLNAERSGEYRTREMLFDCSANCVNTSQS